LGSSDESDNDIGNVLHDYFKGIDKDKNLSTLKEILKFSSEEVENLAALSEHIAQIEPTLKQICQSDLSMKERVQLYVLFIEYCECEKMDEQTEIAIEFQSVLKSLEKSKKLQQSFGEDDVVPDVIDFITDSNAGKEIKSSIMTQYNHVKHADAQSSEYQSFSTWFSWIKQLPIHSKPLPSIVTDADLFMTNCNTILNRQLFGLSVVKRRVLAILYNRHINSTEKSRAIGFIGDPGVGKTMLAKIIAECEGRKLERVLANEKNALEGNNLVWSGASPGQICRALCRAGSSSCCILIDEIDKLSLTNDDGATMALLQVLDPDHNHSFNDNYISHFPLDLSKVCFILTANNTTIHPAVMDRALWIKIPKYTLDERKSIVTEYVIPKLNKGKTTPIIVHADAINAMLNLPESTSVRWIEGVLQGIFLEKSLENDIPAFRLDEHHTDIMITDINKYMQYGKDTSYVETMYS
jgi:ATP-dependent Lon protease